MKSGYGSSNLAVTLNNGMITTVNQQADPEIPQTITALGSLGITSLLRSRVKGANSKDASKCPGGGRPALYEVDTYGRWHKSHILDNVI
jgi:hypothetical protein